LEKAGQLKPLTEKTINAVYPTLDTTGNFLVYSQKSANQPHYSLFLQNLTTGKTTKLFSGDDGDAIQAAFSIDGKRLAFSGPLGPNHEPRIGLFNFANGETNGNVEMLASDGKAYYPAFDPQRSALFFTEEGGDATTTSMRVIFHDLESGEHEPISAAAILAKSPALSRDGRYLVYLVADAAGHGSPSKIYLHDRKSGETLIVTPTAKVKHYRPAFRTDGSLVYSKAEVGKPYQLMVISAESLRTRKFEETVFLPNNSDRSHIMVTVSSTNQ
jgi:Tol biopolymer transport system component